jgi:hypothetical protein
VLDEGREGVSLCWWPYPYENLIPVRPSIRRRGLLSNKRNRPTLECNSLIVVGYRVVDVCHKARQQLRFTKSGAVQHSLRPRVVARAEIPGRHPLVRIPAAPFR